MGQNAIDDHEVATITNEDKEDNDDKEEEEGQKEAWVEGPKGGLKGQKGPKGFRPEVGVQRAPKVLVFSYFES